MNPTKHIQTIHRTLSPAASGRYSSLLDMGGIPSAAADTRINVGKNNKVRAVALDFHLITRSIDMKRKESQKAVEAVPESKRIEPVKPDLTMVEKMAQLLNIKLGDSSPIGQRTDARDDTEDLASKLLGDTTNDTANKTPKQRNSSGPHIDIRSKYASKLRNKIEGGIAGVDLLNYERGESNKRGDASSHLAAKTLLASRESNVHPSSSRWLATTGVGQLLSFLTGRSMQIILLPVPSTRDKPIGDEDVERNKEEMTLLTKQLPHVQFDVCLYDGRRKGPPQQCNENAAQDILRQIITTVDIPPLQYAVVSDRDDYLRAARELGMFTIRVRPKNQRRGDVTASYSVEDVSGVEEVINEINGISFNSALKR
jgi:hypothetical protein